MLKRHNFCTSFSILTFAINLEKNIIFDVLSWFASAKTSVLPPDYDELEILYSEVNYITTLIEITPDFQKKTSKVIKRILGGAKYYVKYSKRKR